MTKDILFSKLEKFISSGYLIEVYSEEEYVVFYFLNKVFVGFNLNENSSENPKGVLLTKWEAEFPVNVASYYIFENIYGNKIEEKSYFEYSDKLCSKCKTLLGKKAIKRQIKNMGYEFSDTLEIDNAKYEGMTYYELFPFVNAYYNKKSEIIKKKQLYNKIYITLSIVSLISAIIVFAFLFTTDIRRSHNPIREYAVFDKNGDSYIYSKVEVDFLTEYRRLYSSNSEYKEGIIYGEYYIYGNSKTNEYGLIKFKESYESYDVLGNEKTKYFDDTIYLYGYSCSIPNPISVNSDPDDIEYVTPYDIELDTPYDNDYSMSNYNLSGTSKIASHLMYHETVFDYSNEAKKLLADYLGISLDEIEIDIDGNFLQSSTEPERVNTLLNEIIEISMTILSLLCMLVYFAALVFAKKVDNYIRVIELFNGGKYFEGLLSDINYR